jgi:CRP-like cAMP-binding protein
MSRHAVERNVFLSGLSAADSAALRSHLMPLELHVGERLHARGRHVEDVVFPQSGLVVLTIPQNGNAAVRMDTTGTGIVLIGHEGIVGGSAAAPSPATSDAEVFVAGIALRMSAEAFRYALDQSPSLRAWAALFYTAILAQAQQTALCHAAHPVQARVCRWILEIQQRTGGTNVPLTQSTIAKLLGVRRTTITVVAGRLQAAGILSCHRGGLEIVKQQELERHSCDCFEQLRQYNEELFATNGTRPAASQRDGRGRASKAWGGGRGPISGPSEGFTER